jgi:hypothetical protein
MGMNRVRQLFDGSFQLGGKHCLGNQFRGVRPDDVNP